MTGPGSTVPRQFAFTTRAHVAVDAVTGEPIGLDDVDIRVRWLLDLIAAAARLGWNHGFMCRHGSRGW